jgi:catechol 2,3-dioxygenase-like lactoylglutathione lyase family enzyme
MVITGVNHITLAVRDLERSFTFYVDVVGLKPVARWARGAYLLAGGDWICLSLDAQTRHGPLPEYTHLAFSVGRADFEDRATTLRASNATLWKDNHSEGKSLYFLDPDGHRLEIHAGDLESRLAALRKHPYEGLQLYV